jgi:hypothetical protein
VCVPHISFVPCSYRVSQISYPIVEFDTTGRTTAKGLVLLLVISMCRPQISVALGYTSQPRSSRRSAAVLDAQWHVAFSFACCSSSAVTYYCNKAENHTLGKNTIKEKVLYSFIVITKQHFSVPC